jgi:hypothetical protein
MSLIMADFNSFPPITDSERFASNNLLPAICFRADSCLQVLIFGFLGLKSPQRICRLLSVVAESQKGLQK